MDGTSASFFLTLAVQNKSVISTQPPSPFYPLAGGVPPPSNHLLLTASFGRILPVSLLSLFRPTHTLNVHPSALPAYRGPAPIQRAILNGERDTAVCVIEMKRRGGIDAGDILGSVPIVRALQCFLSSAQHTQSCLSACPSVVHPTQRCIRPSSRHPRSERRGAPRFSSPFYAPRHRKACPSKRSHAHNAPRAFHHPSRFATGLHARNSPGHSSTSSRSFPSQTINDLSPCRHAYSTDSLPVRFYTTERCADFGGPARLREVS